MWPSSWLGNPLTNTTTSCSTSTQPPLNLDSTSIKHHAHGDIAVTSHLGPSMSLVAQFLTQIRQYVRNQQGDMLRSWLRVEPGSDQKYYDMAAELRAKFAGPEGVEAAIEQYLPIEDDVPDGQATVWPSFQSFMKDYLTLWRDINYEDLLRTHELLTTLVK